MPIHPTAACYIGPVCFDARQKASREWADRCHQISFRAFHVRTTFRTVAVFFDQAIAFRHYVLRGKDAYTDGACHSANTAGQIDQHPVHVRVGSFATNYFRFYPDFFGKTRLFGPQSLQTRSFRIFFARGVQNKSVLKSLCIATLEVTKVQSYIAMAIATEY